MTNERKNKSRILSVFFLLPPTSCEINSKVFSNAKYIKVKKSIKSVTKYVKNEIKHHRRNDPTFL